MFLDLAPDKWPLDALANHPLARGLLYEGFDSTDWFYNRRAEIERLRSALHAARESAEAGIRIDGANSREPVVATTVEDVAIEIPAPVERKNASLCSCFTTGSQRGGTS
jgi:hypothetical protein